MAKLLLSEGEDISSLDGIEKYFQWLYRFEGESLDKKKILQEFQDKQYNFCESGEGVWLIEQNTKTIFVVGNQEAEELLQQIRMRGVYKEYNEKNRSILCYSYMKTSLKRMHGAGMVSPVSGEH